MQEIINKYLTELVNNSQNTNYSEGIIYTEKDYLLLLNKVVHLINKYPNADFFTIKSKLYEESNIDNIVKNIVYEKKDTPSLLIDFGTFITRDTILCGNIEEYKNVNGEKIESIKNVEKDTIYELASTSKLFTTLAIYILKDKGLIDLDKKVIDYVPQFMYLKNVSVNDLLKFKVKIVTSNRIDSAKSPDEAEEILFSAHPLLDQDFLNGYTDIGAMVLKYVIEKTSKIKFDLFIQYEILDKLRLDSTFTKVPYDLLDKVASNNFNAKVVNGKIIENFNTFPGTAHDEKTIAMGCAPGHAGYYSSMLDMTRLATALIKGKIISRDSLLDIANNNVGKKINDEFSFYYGSLVFLKQPDQRKFSAPASLSGRGFMSPGFTGPNLIVDPLNEFYSFVGANRLHNRIYSISNDLIEEDELGRKYYQDKTISMPYAKNINILLNRVYELSIEYKFLEIIFNKTKELKLVREL